MAEVLVVDDDQNNRLLLATLLRHAGHTIVEASDAAAALAIVEEKLPALIIVDLALPGTSGAQLIRQLRANHRTANVKLALYTATEIGPALEELTDAFGVSAVIPKPGNPREILEVLQRLLAP